MNCKKCNAFVPDDSSFCPECGEKVEVVWTAPSEPEAQVFCPNCGSAMSATDGFCENCGTKVEAAPEKPAKKLNISPKLLKIGIAAVAVLLVLAIVLGICAGGAESSIVLFYQDDSLMSVDLPSGKPIEITDEGDKISDSMGIYADEDGNRLFYIEDGELVYRPIGKKNSEATKIAKDVTEFKITANGKKVFYTKNSNLYVHNLKDSTKIASDVDSFYIAPDGKTVAYVVVKTTDDGVERTMYRKTGSNLEKAEAKKIASDVYYVFWCDEKLDTVYFVTRSEDSISIYSQTGKKDKVKITSDSSLIGSIYDDGSFYYVETEEDDDGNIERTLYFYDGKKSSKLTSDYTDDVDYAYDEAVLLFSYIEEGEDDEEDEITYYVATGTTLASLSGEDVSSVRISDDGKNLLILKDYEDGEGTLYEAKISGKKIGEPKKVSDDVSSTYGYLGNGKHYYYTDVKDGEGTLYVNGKKILDDVSTSNRYYNEEDGRLYFFTDVKNSEGTLYFTTGSKATKVADDVYTDLEFSADGQALYMQDYKNGEGTLYVIKGSKGKKIAEDASDVAAIICVDRAY